MNRSQALPQFIGWYNNEIARTRREAEQYKDPEIRRRFAELVLVDSPPPASSKRFLKLWRHVSHKPILAVFYLERHGVSVLAVGDQQIYAGISGWHPHIHPLEALLDVGTN